MKSVGEAMSLGPQLHRGAEQGDALDGDQGGRVLDRARPGRRHARVHAGRAAHAARRPALHRRAGAAAGRHRWPRSPRRPAASTRGSSTRSPSLVDLRARDRRRAGAGRAAAAPGQAGRAVRPRRSPRCARSSPARTACARCATGSALRPVYKTVDTCAAEFAAHTPYHYSSYDEETEVAPSDRPKVLILGSGPEPDRPGHRVRLLVRARGAWRCARPATRP